MAGYRIGYCITAHGFGHAARAVAVMEALARLVDVEFVIVSAAPSFLFTESPVRLAALHAIQTDVGLVQCSPLQEDMAATVAALDGMYPLQPDLVGEVAGCFSGCRLVLCDIAPLGIAAAARAGIPSLLVENFTWDWIYEGYTRKWPDLQPHIDYLHALYGLADYHLQTEPVCRPVACDLRVVPVSRRPRQPAVRIRELLQVELEQDMILVTMGGIAGRQLDTTPMSACRDMIFVLPGSPVDRLTVRDNLRLLPADSGIHHPDLIAAADRVIGKVGYSTLAEVHAAGTPFAYICRPGFPESGHLVRFIRQEMDGVEIPGAELESGNWPDRLATLPKATAAGGRRENGADTIARFLVSLLRF